MLKKLMLTILCIFFMACMVLGIVTTVYFVLPSRKAEAGIHLPEQVEDPAGSEANDSMDSEQKTYDNIYVADVSKDLSLRTEPVVKSDQSNVIASLAPLTHMQVIEYIDGTSFAYVEVINGAYAGMEGYVNYEYITKLGEHTTRVGNQ